MTEWAELTPAERGQARLNFQEARQLPAPDRSARWEEYQALPAEQRQQLAARAASAASAIARSAGAPSRPRRRDSKEAKSNIVPNPALAQPPRPVAPTVVQAAPGRDDDAHHAPADAAAAPADRHAEDRGDARVREPIDAAAAARAAGRGGRAGRRRRPGAAAAAGPARGEPVAAAGRPAASTPR